MPRPSVSKNRSLTNGLTNGDSKHTTPASDAQLFVFSARSQKSVTGLLESAKQWVQIHTKTSELEALSNTLLTRRTAFPWRTSVVASNAEDLITKLGQNVRPVKESQTRVTMVFSGQGAQWFAMGKELISTQSKFRESILKSESLLQELGATWKLTDVLSQSESESIIDRSDVSQPACTALQVALVDLLESLAIRPTNVVGHSSGEMAAAYAAGALTHEAAVTAAYHRGFVAGAVNTIMKTTGAMIAVGLSEAAVLPFIGQLTSGKAVVACVNSPKSVTVSGDFQAIDELKAILDSQADPIFNRKLKVDTAYHSHHMAVVGKRYFELMAGLETYDTKEDVAFFSSVTGELKKTGFGPQYVSDQHANWRNGQTDKHKVGRQSSRPSEVQPDPRDSFQDPEAVFDSSTPSHHRSWPSRCLVRTHQPNSCRAELGRIQTLICHHACAKEGRCLYSTRAHR